MAVCKSYSFQVTGTSCVIQWIDCDGNNNSPGITVNAPTTIYLDNGTDPNHYPCAQEGTLNITGSDYVLTEVSGCGSNDVYTFTSCMDGTNFSLSGFPFTSIVDSTIYRMDFNRTVLSAECATYYSALTSGATVISVLGSYYDTNTGYTCNSSACTSGYTVCVNSVGLTGSTASFCLRGTGIYDDNYLGVPQYYWNGYNYYTGQTTAYYIYFSTDYRWCLSNQLGGTCFMYGPTLPRTICPNLSTLYFSEDVCVTPTPTPTINCDALEFEAIFNCEVTNTPTPTNPIQPTPTPTVTPTDSTCSGTGISATLLAISPTPTPTMTMTPTPSSPLDRPCNFVGEVTFTTVNTQINCPSSQQFQDCTTGLMYYTTEEVLVPGGGSLEKFAIYLAIVDNVSICLGYIGVNYDVIGVNDITLLQGPLGYINLGDCVNCIPGVSATPTRTPTPTLTPTKTPTPTPSALPTYYVYQRCSSPVQYLIQNTIGPPFAELNAVFKDTGRNQCWKLFLVQQYTPPSQASLGSPYVTNYNGNYFIGPYLYEYASCATCLSS